MTGSTIDVVIDDVVASGGYFEFRLCDNKQLAVHDPHQCFQNGLLTFKDSSTRLFNIKNGENKLKLILPTNVTCDQCVLQWKYRTGNYHITQRRSAESNVRVLLFLPEQSKICGKDKESIQSSTTPDPGYHMGK